MFKLNEQALEMVSGGIEFLLMHGKGGLEIVAMKFSDAQEAMSFNAHIRRETQGNVNDALEDDVGPLSYCGIGLFDEFKLKYQDWLIGKKFVVSSIGIGFQYSYASYSNHT